MKGWLKKLGAWLLKKGIEEAAKEVGKKSIKRPKRNRV